MTRAVVRLYGALGDFVEAGRRGAAIACEVDGTPSVKDLIEALGPPHCEVFLVLADGEPVRFDHRVRDGARVAAYPHFGALPADGLLTATPPLPRDGRFVLDGHLGRLAAYLRALGLDTWHRRDGADPELARIAADEGRVLLTRDIALLKRGCVVHGWFVRATRPLDQLVLVLRRFGIAGLARPFTRCLRCNALLVDAPPDLVAATVPARIRAAFDEFAACPSCRRAYWRGSHHDRLSAALEGALRAAVAHS